MNYKRYIQKKSQCKICLIKNTIILVPKKLKIRFIYVRYVTNTIIWYVFQAPNLKCYTNFQWTSMTLVAYVEILKNSKRIFQYKFTIRLVIKLPIKYLYIWNIFILNWLVIILFCSVCKHQTIMCTLSNNNNNNSNK